jgi:hypothetical protein
LSVYTRAVATAARLITKYGQPVTLTHKTPGAYDPATGTATETTATQLTTGAVFNWASGVIDGTLIRTTDRQLYMPAVTTAPELGDTVTIGAIVYTLVEPLKPLSPGGVVVFYECNIRGA